MPDSKMHDASARPAPAAPPQAVWILLLGALGAVYWAMHWAEFYHRWREDLRVYALAVGTWLRGGNPYSSVMAPLYFLYPPAFLYLAKLIGYVTPAGWGGNAYTVLHVVATIALPLVLARFFFPRPWLGPLFALLLFFGSPRFTGLLALLDLNIASTAYCLAFVAAIPGLKRNNWWWFYGAILLVASVKITFLALLLLPLLAGRRQWLRSIGCGAAVTAVNLIEKMLTPELYAGYQWSLKQGIVGEGTYGFGVFGIVEAYGYKLHLPLPLTAYAAAGLVSLMVLGMMVAMRRRLDAAPEAGRALNWVWLSMVVAAIMMMNPRQLDYDADIALFAGYMLWVYGLGTRRLLPLAVVLFLPSLAVPYVVKALHLHGMYGTLEVLAGFGLAYWRLWRETGAVDRGLAATYAGLGAREPGVVARG